MFCGFCGKEVPDGAAICPACGEKITPVPAQQPAAPAQPAYGQSAYQQPAAPAQPAYGQSAYQQPAAPARPAYGQPAYQQPAYAFSAPQGAPGNALPPRQGGNALFVLSIVFSAIAFAITLVLFLMEIEDWIDWAKNLERYSRYQDDAVWEFIVSLFEELLTIVCAGLFFIFCIVSKRKSKAITGVPLLIGLLPTFKTLFAWIFDIEIFDTRYSYDAEGAIFTFLWIGTIVMYLVTNANRNDVIALKIVVTVLIGVIFIRSIVKFGENISDLIDYGYEGDYTFRLFLSYLQSWLTYAAMIFVIFRRNRRVTA